MTITQRGERKTQRSKRRRDEPHIHGHRQNEASTSQRQPFAMEIPHESPSSIHHMPNLNNFTDSQLMQHGQSQEDPYNNITIKQ